MSERGCSVDGCDRKHVAQGFCHTHYVAARRTGEIQKLDQSGQHLMDNVDPVARTGTCSVCGEVPAWSRGGRWTCGKRGREYGAKYRKQESVLGIAAFRDRPDLMRRGAGYLERYAS